MQSEIEEFKRKRQQLQLIAMQRRQLEAQTHTLTATLKELTESQQEKVFKAVGNILIQKNSSDVQKELTDLKDQADLRLKTLAKQEETLVTRLNKLKSQIEGSSKGSMSEDEDDEDTENEK